MPDITLDRAVGDLLLCADTEREAKRSSPFFFIVGAGISTPSVPLASQMIHRLEDRLRQKGEPLPTPGQTVMARYVEVFKLACPSARARQQFLHDKALADVTGSA